MFGKTGRNPPAVNDEAHNGLTGMLGLDYTSAADLEGPCQHGVRTRQQSAGPHGDENAVVAHEAREKPTPSRFLDDPARECRLPAAGRAAQKDSSFTDDHAGSVDDLAAPGHHHRVAAGSRTRKIAPRRSSVFDPGLFSAQIRPRWATTIWREIDNPSPEFCPKPWSGRSV